MKPVLLSPEELRELTGYKLPSFQIKWLEARGVKFWVDRFKHPKVPRSVIDGQGSNDEHAGFELGEVG